MWYVFPQIVGLGTSTYAKKYGIKDLDEAREYLAHPVLSTRLLEISEALLKSKHNNAEYIFGGINAMKLRSSMTLFSLVSEEGSVFHQVLDKFFEGKPDKLTLQILEKL